MLQVGNEVRLKAKTQGATAPSRRLTAKIQSIDGNGDARLSRALSGFYCWPVNALRKA